MNSQIDKWAGRHLESSLAWIRCLAVLIPAALLTGMECRLVVRHRAGNACEAGIIATLEAANRDNAAEIARVQAKLGSLEKEADSVLGGILKEDQNAPDLRALEKLGTQESVSGPADDVIRLRLSGGDIEYHVFVPALNKQETIAPLMRCTWLSLKTTGKPFHTSALPLQVDLEVAFPRVSARTPAATQKSVEK